VGVAGRSSRWPGVVGLFLAVVMAGCTGAPPDPARRAPVGLGSVVVPERSGTFDVMGHPQLVAAGAGAVWVLNPPDPDGAGPGEGQGGRLLRIDPAGGIRSVMRFRGLGDGSLAVGEGAVWLVEPASASLTRYALGSGRISERRPFGAGRAPVLMAVGEGFVWVVLDGPDPALAKVHPRTMRVVRWIALASAGGVAVGAGRVWVGDPDRGLVRGLDPATGRGVGPPARVGTGTAGLAVGEGSLWVLNWDRDLVTRVALGPGRRVSAPVPAGRDAFDFAVGAGSVWVTNRDPGTVTRIDAWSGRPSGRPIRVGESPKGVAVLAGSAWVANSGSRSVTRLTPP
jgi:streptogramin lyase